MWSLNPFALPIQHFQPGHGIRRKDGDIAIVTVGSGATIFPFVAASARRIVKHSQGRDRQCQMLGEEFLIQPQIKTEATVNGSAQLQAMVKIVQGTLTPAVNRRPEIDSAKRFSRQDIRVIIRKIRTDIEGFLHIRTGLRVQLLIRHRHVATVMG